MTVSPQPLDFMILSTPTLKKYKKLHKLQIKTNNKNELINAVKVHFENEDLKQQEIDVVYNFIKTIKSKKRPRD